MEGQGSNTIRESLLAGEGGVGVCLFHFLKRANSCSTDVDVLVRPDGSRWLSGHRAGGTVAYEGVPLVPSATSTNYFFGVRDPKKIEKMTCSHALVMEMRSHLVASGDSNANLAGKMSYGESRSELIDTFGSRKVQYQLSASSVIFLLMLGCLGENCSSEGQIISC